MIETVNPHYIIENEKGESVEIQDLTNNDIIDLMNDRKRSINIRHDLIYTILSRYAKERGIDV